MNDLPDRRFEALVFDWDGTAVPDRQADAEHLRALIEGLCEYGMHIGIVSGTHVDNVDGQLRARPDGPGRLLVALNRGSEIFAVDRDGPQLVERREATAAEEVALDRAAAETVRELSRRGLRTGPVSTRLNRRKIDLIPEPEWRDPPKAVIDRLLEAVNARLTVAGIAGLTEVVTIAEEAGRVAGLDPVRVTSDVKHVEIGLTDKRDSAHWLFGDLADRGVGAGLVLIAGDEFGTLGGVPGSDSWMLVPEAARATAVSVGIEPTGTPSGVVHLDGGPARFLELLEDQLERRRRGDVPDLDDDPAWTLTFEGIDPERERGIEAVLALCDGRLGSRGSSSVPKGIAQPMVMASGLYDGAGSHTHLLACPTWQQVSSPHGSHARLRRVLDLRTGVLHEWHDRGVTTWHSLSFSSLARPANVVLRAECPAGTAVRVPPLVVTENHGTVEVGRVDGKMWIQMAANAGGVAAAASHHGFPRGPRAEVLQRFGAYVVDPHLLPDPQDARDQLHSLERAGFERLLGEHREAWARRWHDGMVSITGDEQLQLGVRFAIRHLLGSAEGITERSESAVGARNLTGGAYHGHVFWDADVFVLPVLVAIDPAAARAMLEYRIRRLAAARVAAAHEGRAGARFPWESADSGWDVTPHSGHDHTGRVPIETGTREVHIVGCVAWAVAHYLDWTDDAEFAAGAGGELLIDTARYWASRLELDADGSAHLRGVVGPDEYHVPVDDNAFTNVLARWNLRRAATVDRAEVGDDERARWLTLADAIVDGYEPQTGRYEQFAGFFDLEPLVFAEVAPGHPADAVAMLGADRVRRAQIVKQADVLMAHHLIPDEMAPGSLIPNLEYYEPRTSHGSSLSPGVHAVLLARAGRADEALALLRHVARIDLDDVTGSTSGGVHLAAMASAWQTLAFGFLGARSAGDALALDPVKPDAWSALELRLRYRASLVTVRVDADGATIRADPALRIVVGECSEIADPEGVTFQRVGGRWRRVDATEGAELLQR